MECLIIIVHFTTWYCHHHHLSHLCDLRTDLVIKVFLIQVCDQDPEPECRDFEIEECSPAQVRKKIRVIVVLR